MASALSNLSPMSAPALHPISEKLMRMTFLVWKVLVLSALKGAQLAKFMEDMATHMETLITDDKKTKMPNPEFTIYAAKEQQVLNFLLSSLSNEHVGVCCSIHDSTRGMGKPSFHGFVPVTSPCHQHTNGSLYDKKGQSDDCLVCWQDEGSSGRHGGHGQEAR
jgi:hypothetical protein